MWWYNPTTQHHITVPPRCGGSTARKLFNDHPDWETGNSERAKHEATRCTIWYKTPMDRWKSWYCQFIIGGHITPLWRTIIEQEEPSLFYEEDINLFTIRFLDVFEKYFWLDTHTIPQAQWVIYDRTYYKKAKIEFVHNDDLSLWLSDEGMPALHQNSSDRSVWMNIDFNTRMKIAQRIPVIYHADITTLPATAVPQNSTTK
jgi:hypothetical protein